MRTNRVLVLLVAVVGVGVITPAAATAQELSRQTIEVALRHITERYGVGQDGRGVRLALATDNFPDAARARGVARGLGITVGSGSELIQCTGDVPRRCRTPNADKVIRLQHVRVAADSVLMRISLYESLELSDGETRAGGQVRELLLLWREGAWQVTEDQLRVSG